ncbi:MAG TPA: alpha/beta hydrolase [Jatrophihabitans sp.]|jgi:pimeloyl-ACP methyl ester carboxylesterase|uniref:alpha/beta fold hydrolase n=1 Tax=Jatrophihabitans sp. TaxID=1932789 RepID=UPI002E002A12|nr:alpha/beta hydrolase [Jatrophihabitans sp.]
MLQDISLESTTSADGTEIAYFRRGVGPALVITHGSVALSDDWIPATEHLAPYFTCLVMDRRGHGRSGDAIEYDLSTEAADIAAVMAVAGPGAHLMGHSYGALCALAYAETGRVEGTLLLFEPPLAVDGPVAGEGLHTYRELIAAGEYDAAIEYAVINIVRVPPDQIPALREAPLWATLVELSPTWTRELEQIDNLGADLTHYASINAAAHLIAGTETTPFLYASAQALVDVLPTASITYLDGMDHFAHVKEPAAFAAAVRAAASR